MTSTAATPTDSATSPNLNVDEGNAALARLAASVLPKIVFVSHALGGGTERHIQDLALLLAGKAEVLILKPAGADVLSLHWEQKAHAVAGHRENFTAYFSGAAEYPQFLEFLKSLPISRMI